MRKTALISLPSVALTLLCGLWAYPALAYFAPMQDVTGPTVVGSNVNVSVHNPATGQDIPYSWTPFGGTGPYVIDQPTKMQGIVAWRVQDTSNNQYVIACGVYDPGWAALQGNPQSGWMFIQTYPWTANSTNIIAVNDGVVVYENHNTTGSKTTALVGVYAYDPSGRYEEFHHGWMPNGWREATFTMTNYSGELPGNYLVKDGVVSFVYGNSVSNAIFDGHKPFGDWTAGWQLDGWYDAPNVTNLQINNATVTWTDTNGSQKRGYDYTTTSWTSGVDTKVMAFFDFWPSPGKPGQPVWFTDMSIGATTWRWTLGDGGVSSARSFYHKYTSAGSFVANLQVSGPVGDDANNKTVPVQAMGSPGSLILLLMAN